MGLDVLGRSFVMPVMGLGGALTMLLVLGWIALRRLRA
jgi:hypothetical protein